MQSTIFYHSACWVRIEVPNGSLVLVIECGLENGRILSFVICRANSNYEIYNGLIVLRTNHKSIIDLAAQSLPAILGAHVNTPTDLIKNLTH